MKYQRSWRKMDRYSRSNVASVSCANDDGRGLSTFPLPLRCDVCIIIWPKSFICFASSMLTLFFVSQTFCKQHRVFYGAHLTIARDVDYCYKICFYFFFFTITFIACIVSKRIYVYTHTHWRHDNCQLTLPLLLSSESDILPFFVRHSGAHTHTLGDIIS